MLYSTMNSDLIRETLSTILDKLGLSFSDITCAQEEDLLRVEITSEAPSRIIGWHGETLNSIQHLVKSIIRQQEGLDRSPFIVLDVDGYRTQQEDKVRKIANQKADFVRRTGSRVALPPMSPYFRRVVHLHVANTDDLQDLTTESAGQGDYRQVVMRLKEEAKGNDGEELKPNMVEANDDGLENLDI